jgi:hypothetical protein
MGGMDVSAESLHLHLCMPVRVFSTEICSMQSAGAFATCSSQNSCSVHPMPIVRVLSTVNLLPLV